MEAFRFATVILIRQLAQEIHRVPQRGNQSHLSQWNLRFDNHYTRKAKVQGNVTKATCEVRGIIGFKQF